MRNGGTKRVFIIALTACFALLLFLFARQSVEDEMKIEQRYPRKNMTISLRVDDDGVLYIDGEGKLYADDLNALVKTEGFHWRKIEHVIIGDGITELGYNTFTRREKIKTLKLGKSVSRTAPSALRKCTALEWLFFPSGLQDISPDFLLDCNRCRVVTEAQPEDLPIPDSIKGSERMFAGVDSFEALRERVGDDTELPDELARWW